ncbi:MAG: 16S rRNA (guanine(527)-N(7))-methyltransferase RsmG [Chromatiales bacterium]|nr:16S rRNA (guanine(527)-N(7))-methyltransferase RsmG [Chromatiales bacterium]
MADEELLSRIGAGATELGLDLDVTQRGQLLGYLHEMVRWGRAYNLTAIRDIEKMVPLHLLDSLAVVPHVRGPRVIDLGTGAGLPGIPLAIVRPGFRVCLMDSSAKKCRFLRHVVVKLGLQNVEVVQSRAENYRPEQGFDTVVSRAVGALGLLMDLSAHLCEPGAQFLAMKGHFPEAELADADERWKVDEVLALKVPGVEADRHLVVCTRL